MPRTVSVQLLPSAQASTAPSSCGLDFWHSRAGLAFSSSFLHARGALLQVSDGSSSAALCCVLRGLPGGLLLASAYPYASIDGDAALFWSAGAQIRRALTRRGVVRLELPFSGEYLPQLPARLPRASRAHVAARMSSVRHVLDFAAHENGGNFEDGFHPNIRWAIRKAVRNGCTVRAASARDVDTIQNLYAATMRAKGAPVNYGAERWSAMLNDLAPFGLASIAIGEIDGKPAGIAACVDAAISRHFIQLAVPPEFQSSRLGELLVATVLREARDAGKRFFDFMASPRGDSGLIAFKAKWGAREEPIKHVILPGVPLLGPLLDSARWLNRAGARLRGE